jgi:hypothetical protein
LCGAEGITLVKADVCLRLVNPVMYPYMPSPAIGRTRTESRGTRFLCGHECIIRGPSRLRQEYPRRYAAQSLVGRTETVIAMESLIANPPKICC